MENNKTNFKLENIMECSSNFNECLENNKKAYGFIRTDDGIYIVPTHYYDVDVKKFIPCITKNSDNESLYTWTYNSTNQPKIYFKPFDELNKYGNLSNNIIENYKNFKEKQIEDFKKTKGGDINISVIGTKDNTTYFNYLSNDNKIGFFNHDNKNYEIVIIPQTFKSKEGKTINYHECAIKTFTNDIKQDAISNKKYFNFSAYKNKINLATKQLLDKELLNQIQTKIDVSNNNVIDNNIHFNDASLMGEIQNQKVSEPTYDPVFAKAPEITQDFSQEDFDHSSPSLRLNNFKM